MASCAYDNCKRASGEEALTFWPEEGLSKAAQPSPGLIPCVSESWGPTEPWDIAILQQLALMEMREILARKNALLLCDHLAVDIEHLKHANRCLCEATAQETDPRQLHPLQAKSFGGGGLKCSASPHSDRDTAASSADGESEGDDRIEIVDSDGEGEKPKSIRAGQKTKTTAILRNTPSKLTRQKLANLLDGHGFAGCYDFLHVPADINTGVALGYAFVNMCSSEAAQRLCTRLQGCNAWGVASSRVCDVSWVAGRHGLEACVQRYRNSHLMHESVPDGFKPAVFVHGKRVPFPRRKGPLRAPQCSGRRSAEASAREAEAAFTRK